MKEKIIYERAREPDEESTVYGNLKSNMRYIFEKNYKECDLSWTVMAVL